MARRQKPVEGQVALPFSSPSVPSPPAVEAVSESGGTLIGQRDEDGTTLFVDSPSTPRTAPRPLIKWIGGKVALAQAIVKWYAARSDGKPITWVEPFFGAGSVYAEAWAELPIVAASVSDGSPELANLWTYVKHAPLTLAAEYEGWRLRQEAADPATMGEEVFYDARDKAQGDTVEAAGAFLFVNRTSFNGLWRVNKKGKANPSWGKRYASKILSLPEWVPLFSGFTLVGNQTWRPLPPAAMKPLPGRGQTFVYCDPPYPGTYDLYVPERLDHAALAQWVAELGTHRGIVAAISGTDSEAERAIYGAAGLVAEPIGEYHRRCGRTAASRIRVVETLWTLPRREGWSS